MSNSKQDLKKQKKSAKAKVKIAKAKAKEKQMKQEGKGYSFNKKNFPPGITINIRERGKNSDLVITGLTSNQMKRILPRLNKELLITFTEEDSPFRASLLRFLREGLFHTVVKIIAGLIVGYLLFYIGLR